MADNSLYKSLLAAHTAENLMKLYHHTCFSCICTINLLGGMNLALGLGAEKNIVEFIFDVMNIMLSLSVIRVLKC